MMINPLDFLLNRKSPDGTTFQEVVLKNSSGSVVAFDPTSSLVTHTFDELGYLISPQSSSYSLSSSKSNESTSASYSTFAETVGSTTSASYATNSSQSDNSATASYALTTNAVVSSSYSTNSSQSDTSTSASYSSNASFAISASYVISASSDYFLKNDTLEITSAIKPYDSIFNPADILINSSSIFIVSENADYYVLGDMINEGVVLVDGTLKIGGVLYNYGVILGSGTIE